MEDKILIVDDEPEIRGLMAKVLTGEGYHVNVARDGEEALMKFHVEPVPLVITDLTMPRIDGILLIKQIKSLYPETMILLVTAHGRMDSAIDAMKAGAENVLAKPVDINHLVIEVAKCFDNLRLRRENESLSNLVEMRNKFITLTDHEFRTPLSIIKGGLAILKSDSVTSSIDDKAKTLVGMMEEASNRLVEIVERFHDMETLHHSWLTPSLSTFNIGEQVWNIVTVASASTRERRMNFDMKNTMDRHEIHQDKSRVEHILMELIQNAIKYTPDGGTVSVWLGETGGDKDRSVIIKILDTGVGLAPDKLKLVLEPFYEIRDVMEHTTSNSRFNGGGIGVGLTRVKMLVESIQGHLLVESAEWKGTTFTVSIPAFLELKEKRGYGVDLAIGRQDLAGVGGS
jgi:signal transduction histidine kinase